MSTRSSIIAAAARLLAESGSGDVSTRAVCDAAGVTQPVLYRHFGDKDGLLSAVADSVWESYLAGKRAAERSGDPLDDLRAGWDNHTAFALENPYAYRLVFASDLSKRPAAIVEAVGLLTAILERLAADGRLAMSPEDAAQVVMAANSGVALGLLLRREVYPDTAISDVTREATLRGILATHDGVDPIAGSAATIRARVRSSDDFTAPEAALFEEWLGRMG
ncbi:TetR/AcrR family transcriptional regulator [Gordonia humi]|uniref:AcrR family transcriptional regulator n=1 Tax=Gordonia humi TaxID=686429 RepID=A0A840FAK1_9ACTN|nr:AcrR family transcriptional regulator [Gordonia humi]